jgi:hypothetical protein
LRIEANFICATIGCGSAVGRAEVAVRPLGVMVHFGAQFSAHMSRQTRSPDRRRARSISGSPVSSLPDPSVPGWRLLQLLRMQVLAQPPGWLSARKRLSARYRSFKFGKGRVRTSDRQTAHVGLSTFRLAQEAQTFARMRVYVPGLKRQKKAKARDCPRESNQLIPDQEGEDAGPLKPCFRAAPTGGYTLMWLGPLAQWELRVAPKELQ